MHLFLLYYKISIVPHVSLNKIQSTSSTLHNYALSIH
nr:MAG TPA: hypothetical protein [Caudoviricetes sp.]